MMLMIVLVSNPIPILYLIEVFRPGIFNSAGVMAMVKHLCVEKIIMVEISSSVIFYRVSSRQP